MNERAPVHIEASGVIRSVLGPERTAYSWGEVVVAAVTGRTVAFYDGDTSPETAHYRTSSEAHEAALDYAISFETARQALAAEARR